MALSFPAESKRKLASEVSCQCVEGSDAIGGCGRQNTTCIYISAVRAQTPELRPQSPGLTCLNRAIIAVTSARQLDSGRSHMLPLRAIRFDRWVGGSELTRIWVGSEWRRKGRRVGEPGEGGALEDAKESRGCAG